MKWPADPELRRRMVEGLLDWIEGLEMEEPAPEGVDPALAGPVPDLYSALAAVEALKKEVGLQGREFRKVNESVREATEEIRATRNAEVEAEAEKDALAAKQAEAAGLEREADRRTGRRDVLAKLLDARDRADRVLGTARSVEEIMAGGFPRASRRRQAFASVLTALRMHVEALDEVLRELDCREAPAEGRVFDPSRMRAVEAADPEEGEPGRVVEVVRSGWLFGEELLRPAEVRVVPGVPGGGAA